MKIEGKNIILIAGILLLFKITTQASNDSLRKGFFYKPGLFFSFDARNSFIIEKKARIGGIKLGVEFEKKYRFGLGIYGMEPPIEQRILYNKGTINEKIIHYRINFSYLAFFTEYVLYQNKKWEFSTPLVFGAGDTRLYIVDSNKVATEIKKIKVRLMEISLAGHYKFFSWIGLGAGVGYRNVYADEGTIKDVFDSYIYIFKLKIFFGVLYRKVFPKKNI